MTTGLRKTTSSLVQSQRKENMKFTFKGRRDKIISLNQIMETKERKNRLAVVCNEFFIGLFNFQGCLFLRF